MVHGQRDGRAHRVRRPVQARRGVPPGVAGAEAAVRSRSVSGRRVLSPQPIARTCRPGGGRVRQRFADGPSDHRNASGRRLGVHPHQRHLDHGKRIIELFNQPQHHPIPVEVQVALLWVVQNGYMDEVAVDRIKDYQARLTEYLTSSKADLLASIAKEKALSDALTTALKAAADQFKQMWT